MSDKPCILCNPDPSALLFRSEKGVVILDDPIRVGHVLVGAPVHVDGLHALPPVDAGNMLSLAADVARIVVDETGAEKVYVAAVGDKDKHFHVHLVPRYGNDDGLGTYIFGN